MEQTTLLITLKNIWHWKKNNVYFVSTHYDNWAYRTLIMSTWPFPLFPLPAPPKEAYAPVKPKPFNPDEFEEALI